MPILQIRDKVIEYRAEDRDVVLSRFQPDGVSVDYKSVEFVRDNLSGVHVEVHRIRPFKI